MEKTHPTLLRAPDLRGVIQLQELPLGGAPANYLVQQHNGWWMVTRLTDGETIYAGPGPVEVITSFAPAKKFSSRVIHPGQF